MTYHSQSTNAGNLGLSGNPQIGPKLSPYFCNACELHTMVTINFFDCKMRAQLNDFDFTWKFPEK